MLDAPLRCRVCWQWFVNGEELVQISNPVVHYFHGMNQHKRIHFLLCNQIGTNNCLSKSGGSRENAIFKEDHLIGRNRLLRIQLSIKLHINTSASLPFICYRIRYLRLVQKTFQIIQTSPRDNDVIPFIITCLNNPGRILI